MKENIKQQLLSILLILTILLANIPIAYAGDIKNHWAEEDIDYLKSKAILSGYTDGRFKPDNFITRAEFIKIVNNLFLLEDMEESNYKDVGEDAWYYKEIAKAKKYGYIKGYEDNTMRPNNFITREEAAVVLSSVFELDLKEDYKLEGQDFSDSSTISSWAKDSLDRLVACGYISGYEDKTIRPKNNITRGEVSRLIKTMTGSIVDSEEVGREKIEGNLFIRNPKIRIKDLKVLGDIYIIERDLDLKIENLELSGDLIVKTKTGSKISIVSSIINNMMVKDKSEIAIDKDTSLATIVLNDEVDLKIEGEFIKILVNSNSTINGDRIAKDNIIYGEIGSPKDDSEEEIEKPTSPDIDKDVTDFVRPEPSFPEESEEEKETRLAVENFKRENKEVLELKKDTIKIDDRKKIEKGLEDYRALKESARKELAKEKKLLDSLLNKVKSAEEEIRNYRENYKNILEETIETIDIEDRSQLEKAIETIETSERLVAEELEEDKKHLGELLDEVKRIEEEIAKFKEENKEVLELKIEDITMEARETIESTIDSYKALSEKAQGHLTLEKERLDLLVKKARGLEDKYIQDLVARIDEIADIEDLSLEDKDSLLALKDEVDSLKEDLRERINNIAKLEASILRIEKLELIEEEVGNFQGEYLDLLDIEYVALEDKEKIDRARSEFSGLDIESKERLNKDHNFEKELGYLKEAVEFLPEINNLASPEDLKLEDKEELARVRKAFLSLASEVQNKINKEKLTQLTEKMMELEKNHEIKLEIENFKEKYSNLLSKEDEDIEIEDRDQVEEAKADLANLSDEAKILLSEEEEEKLENFSKIIYLKEEAKEIIDKIDQLPEVADLKLADKEEVFSLKAEYDEKSDAVKGYITNYSELEKRIEKINILIEEYNKEKAREVDDKIDSIKDIENLTLEDEAYIKEVRNAYEKLTDIQKEYVKKLDKLEKAEIEIELIKEDRDFAKLLDEKIGSFSKKEVKLESIKDIEAIREEYNSLTDRQKGFVENLDKLIDMEVKVEDLKEGLKNELDKIKEDLGERKKYYSKNDQVKIDGLLELGEEDIYKVDEKIKAIKDFLESTSYKKLIGDEEKDGLFIVNREYRDNNIQTDNIGSIGIFFGKGEEVTDQYSIKYYDKKDGEEVSSIDLKDGGTTVSVYMVAESEDKKLPKLEEVIYIKYRSVLYKDKYYTIEDALRLAENDSLNDEEKNIIVAYNTSFADSDIGEDLYGGKIYTVAKGVTLLLPYNSEYNTKIDNMIGGGRSISRNEYYVELKVPENIEINVEGIFTVNGNRTYSATKYQGHTSGSEYSKLRLEKNSRVNALDGGVVSSIGYIYGPGEIEAFSGSTVYEPMFIKSFRGGSATMNISSSVFPFDQYTINNIESKFTINQGANYNLSLALFIRGDIKGDLKLIGPDESSLIEMESGKIVKRYNSEKGKVQIDIYGNSNINNTEIKISAFSADSKNKDMPFDGTWELTAKSGSKIKLNSWMMLLPGARLNIEENAELIVTKGNKLTVFNPYHYIDDYNTYPNKGVESRYRINPKFDFTSETPGILNLDGVLVVEDDSSIAGKLNINEKGSLKLSDTSKTNYFIKYVSGSASSAKTNSRYVSLWDAKEGTIDLISDTDSIVRDKESSISLTAIVKDSENNPIENIDVEFSTEDTVGSWSEKSVKTDENGKASTTYTRIEPKKEEEEGTKEKLEEKLVLEAKTLLDNTKVAISEIEIKDSSGGCPFIYSFDGKEYHFEHEPVSYSTSKAFENTSYGSLEKLKEDKGYYRIRLTEEKDSITFANGINLFAVDYIDENVEKVFSDIYGEAHTIEKRNLPKSFVDSKGKDWLKEISTNKLVNSDYILEMDDENIVTYEAVFTRPEIAVDRAKFMVSARATNIIDSLAGWFYDILDGENNIWWVEKALSLSPNLEKFIDAMSVINLEVELWDGNRWIKQGEVELGSHLMEEFLIPIDLSLINESSDEVKIRLKGGAGFFEIDKVSVDFSENKVKEVRKLELDSAKYRDKDVTSIISDMDNDKRVKMERGDFIDLYYNTLELEDGMKRGFIVEFKGYFHVVPKIKENSIVDSWVNKSYEEVLELAIEEQENAKEILPVLDWLNELVERNYLKPMDEKIENIIKEQVFPWMKNN